MIVAEKNIEHRPALMQLINYITVRTATWYLSVLQQLFLSPYQDNLSLKFMRYIGNERFNILCLPGSGAVHTKLSLMLELYSVKTCDELIK